MANLTGGYRHGGTTWDHYISDNDDFGHLVLDLESTTSKKKTVTLLSSVKGKDEFKVIELPALIKEFNELKKKNPSF